MKIQGDNVGQVAINGMPLDPAESLKVFRYATKFSWGRGGSEPTQLALAILLAAGLPSSKAMALHHRFNAAFLAALPEGPFSLDVDVTAWATEQNRLVAAASAPLVTFDLQHTQHIEHGIAPPMKHAVTIPLKVGNAYVGAMYICQGAFEIHTAESEFSDVVKAVVRQLEK